jgi:hypothetical protein
MPIEYGSDMGCGDIYKPLAEKFHGNMTQNLPACGAREGDCIPAEV